MARSLFSRVLTAALLLGPISAQAGRATAVYSFQSGNDANGPEAGLVNVGGTLYGTTFGGGVNGAGTVFSVTAAGVEKVVYSFKGGADGFGPASDLINVGGTFYGTTFAGGSGLCGYSGTNIRGCGTVFRVTPAGSESVVYSFTSGTDGANPVASVIESNGVLYGTTEFGGSPNITCNSAGPSGCGTVFRLTLAGEETVLHIFQGGTDGVEPTASLIDVNGLLYGTTVSGGDSGGCDGTGGCGTVFSITRSGTEKLLYAFQNGSDGAFPKGRLINFGGVLYGTTELGGKFTGCVITSPPGCGTVFAMTPAGVETIVYSFQGKSDGGNPEAGLINIGGVLYGTASDGGSGGNGVVFSVTPSGTLKSLSGFPKGAAGQFLLGDLISVGHTLYGTAARGGTADRGTIFELRR